MSELMNTRRKSFRHDLLATASILVLAASVYPVDPVKAEDADRPVLWIELGGQLEQIGGNPEKFAPDFLTAMPRPEFEGFDVLDMQNPSRYAFGGEGKIAFNPEGSDWTISAAIRYGRSHGNPHKTAHTNQPSCHQVGLFGNYRCVIEALQTIVAIDVRNTNNESHSIVDFQAGKDVGLGLFGSGGKSLLGFGVRYAQLHQTSTADVNEVPDLYFPSPFSIKYDHKAHHRNELSADAQRNFHGIGPSISWDAFAPAVKTGEDSAITFDWGLNASLLFGRQTAKTHHRTSEAYYCTVNFFGSGCPAGLAIFPTRVGAKYSRTTHTADSNRSRSIVVPNAGGFAGISLRYPNAKLSVGYRGDFFFGAIDGGIDTRKSTTRGFFGPFASISVGLGD